MEQKTPVREYAFVFKASSDVSMVESNESETPRVSYEANHDLV